MHPNGQLRHRQAKNENSHNTVSGWAARSAWRYNSKLQQTFLSPIEVCSVLKTLLFKRHCPSVVGDFLAQNEPIDN